MEILFKTEENGEWRNMVTSEETSFGYSQDLFKCVYADGDFFVFVSNRRDVLSFTTKDNVFKVGDEYEFKL